MQILHSSLILSNRSSNRNNPSQAISKIIPLFCINFVMSTKFLRVSRYLIWNCSTKESKKIHTLVHARLLEFWPYSHPARSYSGLHAYYSSRFLKDFCQIFRTNLENFWRKLGSFSGNHWLYGSLVTKRKSSVFMNKTASFHPALFLVF